MTYLVTYKNGGTFRFNADLSQASAPMYWVPNDDEDFGDESVGLTPFQTADAQHEAWKAAKLIGDYLDFDGVIESVEDEDSNEES